MTTGAAPSNARIVAAGAGHLDAIAALFAGHTGRSADVATMANWIETSPAAVALDGPACVGYCLTTRFAPDIVELASLFVHPTARSHGLGAALITEVTETCRRRGTAAMITTPSEAYVSLEPKQSSVPLYVRLGWHVVHETADTAVLMRSLEDRP